MTFSLPPSVIQKLGKLLDFFPLDRLQEACKSLSQAYQEDQNSKNLFQDPLLRAAYLATRLPATFACLKSVLMALDDSSYKSLLDLGAGPSTAMGVLNNLGYRFEEVINYEQNEALFQEGHSLWDFPREFSSSHTLKTEALTSSSTLPKADLIIMNFFLGELGRSIENKLLEAAWAACEKTLVIVEPGTPGRFEKIRQHREKLIEWGGYIKAPCPHAQACPMENNNWCHFCVKIDRPDFHRRIKQVTHPFELEKYSYLIVSKETPQTSYEARIISQPRKKSGHILLDLCTAKGHLNQQTISKRDKKAYQDAKKYHWGDVL